MRLVFLYGPPAAGKLTLGSELAAFTGYRLFHNHLTVNLAREIFDFGSEPFQRLVDQLRLRVFAAAAQSDLPGLIFTEEPESLCFQAGDEWLPRLTST